MASNSQIPLFPPTLVNELRHIAETLSERNEDKTYELKRRRSVQTHLFRSMMFEVRNQLYSTYIRQMEKRAPELANEIERASIKYEQPFASRIALRIKEMKR